MTAKEYLAQYRMIKARLRAIEAMVDEAREELSAINDVSIRSAWPDGQPHGTGTTDPVGNQAATAADKMTQERRDKLRGQLEDLEIRELKVRSELWRQRMEIEEVIGAVSDPAHHDVLHRRYIQGQKFELIAVEMDYSYRHTIRLHGEALLEVAKIMKK